MINRLNLVLKYTLVFLALIIPLFYILYFLPRFPNAGYIDLGTASITPDSINASSWGSLKVNFVVGSSGINKDGGIKIQFPKSFQNAATSRVPQISSSTSQYYVSAKASNPAVSLQLSVINKDINNESSTKLDYTVLIKVKGSNLNQGDIITYTFGDTSKGGKGINANNAVASEPVKIAVDYNTSGIYQNIQTFPVIKTKGNTATRLQIITPSIVQKDSSFQANFSALDYEGNNSSSYSKTVSLSSSDNNAQLPESYQFISSDEGKKTFAISLNTPGIQTLSVSDGTYLAKSNSINVVEALPTDNLFWGDLHVHSEVSSETFGNRQSEIDFARDVSNVDFFAFLDHGESDTNFNNLTPNKWQETKDILNSNYAPGNFVTFLGYEWSPSGTFQGHRGVYYCNMDNAYFTVNKYKTITSLWGILATNGYKALTVPHHTGLASTQSNVATSWTNSNVNFQRTLEIYQVKGFSEYYNPSHPLSIESLTGWYSYPGPYYAQDAWETGQRLGIIASSDEHFGKPGRSGYGLAAVYAPELTREAIFDAIYNRHTYATTGERIILNFDIDGHIMGDEFYVNSGYKPTINIKAIGTDNIEYIELLKYDGKYSVIYSFKPNLKEASFQFIDNNFSKNSFYYVRLKQVNKVEKRDVMAWSSPIWIDIGENPTPTPSPTPTSSPTPNPTVTPTPTLSPTPTSTLSPTPTVSPMPTPTPSPTPGISMFEYFNTLDDGSVAIYANNMTAQTFTPLLLHTANLIKVKTLRLGLPGNITLTVKATDSFGKPYGDTLATAVVDGNTFTTGTNGDWYSFNIPLLILQANKKYSIILKSESLSQANSIKWRGSRNYATYSGGSRVTTIDGGTAWNLMNSYDMLFEEWGY